MKRNPDTKIASQAAPDSQAIDGVLLQFELAAKAGQQVAIADWLERYPELNRPALLEALLFAEWGLRRKRRDAYSMEEYLHRMQADRETIERAWREFHAADAHSLSYLTIDLAAGTADRNASAIPVSLGRFREVQRLGSGGMGMVFTAFDPERNTRVALKTIKHVGGEAVYRFKREFRALADIAHPNLCPLYELLMIDGVWFITMPYIEGLDLVRHVRSLAPAPPSSNADASPHSVLPPTKTDPSLAETEDQKQPSTLRGEFFLDPSERDVPAPQDNRSSNHRPHLSELCDERNVRDVFAQITRGMMALHQSGRLHRDLKPANVILDRDGHALVLDFGLVAEAPRHHPAEDETEAQTPREGLPHSNARAVPKDSLGTEIHVSELHMSQTIEGTPQYMAPEQAMGLADLTPACDWYALGVMLFEVLTGDRPFVGTRLEVVEQKKRYDAPHPDEKVAGIPSDLSDLCIRLLHRDPKMRPNGNEILQVMTGCSDAQAASGWLDQRLPFVGREHLLSDLDAVTQRVREGRPAIVRIHGRSGVGKSSIIQRFLDTFQHPRDLVLRGRCYEQESVPYKALDGIMDALSTVLAAMSPGSRRRYLPSNAAELARVFEVLQRIPEFSNEASQLPVSEPGELRRRAMTGFRELLSRLSKGYRILLSVDDFQWGDVESADILLDLFCQSDPPDVMLLISYRDEYESTSDCLIKWLKTEPRAAAATEILDMPIGPLTDDEAASLASELLPKDLEHRDAYLTAIVRESSGNPFFVIELALAAAQGRGLPMQTQGERQRILDEVLWNRIQELPSDAQQLLQTIAVAGQPTRMDVVYEASGFSIRDPKILTRLRIDRLVRSSGPNLTSELEAYHDRIRETVVSHLPAPVKLQHHRALAESLERKPGTDAETLAVHFLGAEMPERAGHYFAIAADKAAESLAFDHAAGLYRQALALLPLSPRESASMRARLGAALANAGRGEQAAIEYASAAESSHSVDQLDLKRKSAYQFCISGHVEKGKAAMQQLLQSVGLSMPESTASTIASLLWHRSALYWRGLRVDLRPEASVPKKLLEQVDLAWSAAAGVSMFELISGCRLATINLRLSLQAGEPRRLVRSLCWEAVQRINAGGAEVATGERMISMAEQIAKDLEDPYASTMIPFARGIGEFMQGNWAHSKAILDEAITQFAKTCLGVHWELGTARLFTLYAMYWHGELAEYHRRAESLHRNAVNYGDFYAELSLGTFDLPFLSLVADRPDDAEKWIDTYRNRLRLGRYSLQDMYVLMQSTNLQLYLGQPETAWSVVLSGWQELNRSMLLRGEHIRMACWELRARAAVACVAAGVDPARSRREALTAIRNLERESLQRFSSLPYLYRAGLAAADNRTDMAIALLRQGIRRASETDTRIYLHPAQWQLGNLLASSATDSEEGESLVSQANEWMQAEGVRNPQRFASLMVPGFHHPMHGASPA